MSIDSALKIGTERVGRRDAVLLLVHLTGLSESQIYMHKGSEIDDRTYLGYLLRREKGEPLQYIIGSWGFMGLDFITDRRALIPRQETELLVEQAFEFIQECAYAESGKPVRVMDLCTGSGCIAVSVALLAAEANVNVEIVAVDKSPRALELAKYNAKSLGAEKRITFVESDLFNGVKFHGFHAIISNPPYIPTADIFALEPVVRDYEPHMALDGGADGLDFYRKIAPLSLEFLHAGCGLFLEIGPLVVENILKSANFCDVKLIKDYAGLPRIVCGWKK